MKAQVEIAVLIYRPDCCCFTDDDSFNDTMDISLPKNVVPGSVYAVVSTVGKWCSALRINIYVGLTLVLHAGVF